MFAQELRKEIDSKKEIQEKLRLEKIKQKELEEKKKVEESLLKYDDFLDAIKSQCLKQNIGILKINSQMHWFKDYDLESNVGIILEHRFEDVRSWARSNGFRVKSEHCAEIGNGSSHGMIGGCETYIKGRNIYGPQITLEW